MKKIIVLIMVLSIVMISSFVLGGFFIGLDIPFEDISSEEFFISVNESKSFSAQDFSSIHIDVVAADVTYYQVTGNQIEVDFSGLSTTSNKELLPTLRTRVTGDELEVSVEYPKKVVPFSGLQSADIKVGVPKSFAVDVSSVSGDILLKDTTLLTCDIQSTSGDIILKNTENNNCDIHSVSGDVFADVLFGRTKLTSVSGDMFIASVVGSLEIFSLSGDVETTFSSVEGRSSFESTSGDITLSIPTFADVSVSANSVSGDIFLSGMNTESYSDDTVKGVKGTGQHAFSISSLSGDITVE